MKTFIRNIQSIQELVRPHELVFCGFQVIFMKSYISLCTPNIIKMIYSTHTLKWTLKTHSSGKMGQNVGDLSRTTQISVQFYPFSKLASSTLWFVKTVLVRSFHGVLKTILA